MQVVQYMYVWKVVTLTFRVWAPYHCNMNLFALSLYNSYTTFD
jgi:hypothetical protein